MDIKDKEKMLNNLEKMKIRFGRDYDLWWNNEECCYMIRRSIHFDEYSQYDHLSLVATTLA